MKHKTELRKGLVKILSQYEISNGEELLLDDKSIGSILTTSGKSALAYVRLKNRDAILSTKNSKKIVIVKD